MPPHIEVWSSVRAHADTKTKKSRRTLALPPQAVAALKTHKTDQAKDRLAAGALWQETNLVFCTTVGTALDAANVRRGFRSVVTKTGITGDWTPRELRHSFVSLLSANGVPVESIAQLVGHSGTTVTEAVYRKELRPVLTDGAEVIGNIFTRNKSAG
jgi:site-specific recombinase XerD